MKSLELILIVKWKVTKGALSMPAFGQAYSDDEIAAVTNYVTARFGKKGAQLSPGDVTELRKQVAE